MNDEIKEILDDLLFTTTLPNVSIKLNKEKLNQLKDYITNLQQENQELKKKNASLGETNLRINGDLKVAKQDRIEYSNELEDYKSRCEKATKDLFELKDMIYKPETRDENIPIQQKISSIIKQLNGRSDE